MSINPASIAFTQRQVDVGNHSVRRILFGTQDELAANDELEPHLTKDGHTPRRVQAFVVSKDHEHELEQIIADYIQANVDYDSARAAWWKQCDAAGVSVWSSARDEQEEEIIDLRERVEALERGGRGRGRY